MKLKIHLLILSFFILTHKVKAQATADSLQEASLSTVIDYTIKHLPAIQKSIIDEILTKIQVKSKIADWYPQLDFNYNIQHNFQLQTANFGGNIIQLGNKNTSLSQLALTQSLINPNLLLAVKTAKSTKLLSTQITNDIKIDAVVNVSKAFYDVLLTQQQIKVAAEDITRLERSLKDATARYESGIVDKIDYKRATISLNNAKALKTSGEEMLKAKYAYLKFLMGYPDKAALEIKYDSTQMENETAFNISPTINYNGRIEYQILETQKKLKAEDLNYAKYSFMPSLNGFGAYNMNFLNNDGLQLYSKNYPNSYAGIGMVIPLSRGGKRLMNIKAAKYQIKKTDLDITDLQNNIDAEYAQAIASYNSNLANYQSLKENMSMANEVYSIIDLQYRAGIKTYLEVVIAQSDLRTSQINYFNALYQVLAAKIDLQKSLGQIKY
ncbi:MAG: TolC family protein [Bacteroidota bacterium]|nr:TolC family protein [Bacteroidota bacterium]